MKLEIECARKAAQFGVIFTQLKSFSDTILLRPDSQGISMQCMDSSKVCLFDSRLAAEWFDVYEFQEGDPVSLGVIPRVIAAALGARRDKQHVCLSAAADQDCIEVTLNGDSEALDKYFSVQLVDAESDLLDLSNPEESQVDLTIATKDLTELVAQLAAFDSQLSLHFGREEITMESRGGEGGLRVSMGPDDGIEYAIGDELKQKFSLVYLSRICGFGKLAPTMELRFSADRPLEACYNLGDDSHATLYLAPKIADADDDE